MATRFYLPSTGAAAVSPAYGGWNNTAQADRRKMVMTKIASAMAGSSITDALQTIGNTHLWRQYVSDPISAQTITGTVKGQLRVSENDVLLNHDRVTILLKVVSNDGSTVRGTLLALGFYGATNEYSLETTRTNRKLADGDAVSSVVAEANDRIVLEVGTQASTTPLAFEANAFAIFGDDSGTDLAEDETATAADNAWFELSQTLSFSQSTTPATVAGPGAVLLASVIIGIVAAVSGAGGVPPVNTKIFVAATVSGVGSVPFPIASAADTYDPTKTTVLVVNTSGPTRTVLRPTTPAVLGDGSRDTTLDSGHIIGPGSGAITHVATVIGNSEGQSGPVTHVKVFALVSVVDTTPFPNVYIPCTMQEIVLKVGAEARGTFGLLSGSVPGVAEVATWESGDIAQKPGGGAWTWPDLDNLSELGVTAQYALGTVQYTNLRLDEIWIEVYGPQGTSNITDIKMVSKVAREIVMESNLQTTPLGG